MVRFIFALYLVLVSPLCAEQTPACASSAGGDVCDGQAPEHDVMLLQERFSHSAGSGDEENEEGEEGENEDEDEDKGEEEQDEEEEEEHEEEDEALEEEEYEVEEGEGMPAKVHHIVLPYTPKPAYKSCQPGEVDLGDNPDEPILEGLAQHMQVALEQTCTNNLLGCAFRAGDHALVSEALGGLFRNAGVPQDDVVNFERGMTTGLEKLQKEGFGKRKEHCPENFAERRKTWITQLQGAWGAHLQGYGVDAAQAWKAQYDAHSFEDLAVSLCDQIGNDSNGHHAAQLSRVVVSHVLRSKHHRANKEV